MPSALPKIGFVAPVVRAAMAQLQTYMPLQVAQFNAEAGNEVTLDAPQTIHFGGEDLLNAYAYPQIEVGVPAGDFGKWSIDRAAADHDERLNIAIWLEGAEGDIPSLYEQTLGMLRCVIECLAPANACGPGVEIAQQKGVSWRADVVPNDPTAFGPHQGRAFQKWLGSGLIQIRLEDVESFT